MRVLGVVSRSGRQDILDTLNPLWGLASQVNIFKRNPPSNDHQGSEVQQDGAPPHYDINVRTFFDEVFPKRWIGRRGAVE
ncbi:hypothetical protein J6590_097215 [Homalodisca vitripennis]|nr:hypothetical protein J6590_097215 [Homalodisca vitripennis]